MTTRFFLYLLGLAAVYLTMNYSGYSVLLYIFLFLLCLPIWSIISLLINFRSLNLALRPEQGQAGDRQLFIRRGESLTLTLLAEQHSFLPQGWVEIFLDPALTTPRGQLDRLHVSLAGNSREYIRIHYDCPHRGTWDVAVRKVKVSDSLGFFTVKLPQRRLPAPCQITVVPDIFALSAQDQSTMTEKFESVTQSDKISQEIDQVAQLRDYQPGDKVRLIHWAVSAHMEKPQIREFEDPNAAEIALIAPWPKPPEASELLQDRSSWKSSRRGGLSGLYRHPGILGPSWPDSFIRLSDAAGDIAAGILLQLARGALPYRFIGPSSDRRSAALTDIRLEVNAPVDPALLALGEQLVDLPLEQAMAAARAANDNLPRLLLDTLPDNVRLCIVVLTELNDLLLEALTALAGSGREVAVVYVSSTEATSAELSSRLARLGIPLLTINCAEVLDRPAPAVDPDPSSPERSRHYA